MGNRDLIHLMNQVVSLLAATADVGMVSSWSLAEWKRVREWTGALEAHLLRLSVDETEALRTTWEDQLGGPLVGWDELCRPVESMYRRTLGNPGIPEETARDILLSGLGPGEEDSRQDVATILRVLGECTERAARANILQEIHVTMGKTITTHLQNELSTIMATRASARVLDQLSTHVAIEDALWMSGRSVAQDMAVSRMLQKHLEGQAHPSEVLDSLSHYVQAVPRGMVLLLFTLHIISRNGNASLASHDSLVQSLYQLLEEQGEALVKHLLFLPPTMALELGFRFSKIGFLLIQWLVQMTQCALLEDASHPLPYGLESYWMRVLLHWTPYHEHLRGHTQILMALSLLDRSVQPPPILHVLLDLVVHRIQPSS